MEFLLDHDVVFLNHGSFGACPRVVFEEYQRMQRRLEAQPVRFLQRELPGLLEQARRDLGRFVGSDDGDLVFIPNPTYGVNEIARSLDLGPGDEVLTTNHEYGACRNAWQFLAERDGFSVVEVEFDVTIGSDDEFVERFWQAVTPATKVIFVSHITSPTALTLPVERICELAGPTDIITVIDGAHAPGQIDLDLAVLGSDFYVATCHKWMCAPKGSSFLHATPSAQRLLDPLVVGWGWGDRRQFDSGSDFLDFHEWLGTDDPSGYLAVPAAIEFQQQHDWGTVRHRCHDLVVEVLERAAEIPGITRVHADDRFQQMGLLEVGRHDERSAVIDPALKARLYDDYRVEVPVIRWTDPTGTVRVFVRVSVQAYNTVADIDALVAALEATAPWLP